MTMPNDDQLHGTMIGWQFHQLANLEPCQACIDWHEKFRTEYGEGYVVEHGSYRGYRWHKMAQIRLCAPCWKANRDYENGRYAERKREAAAAAGTGRGQQS